MLFNQPYRTGMGEPVTAVVGLVSSAITIFSAIAAKNQAIKDGLTLQKNEVKALQDGVRLQIEEMRLMRDGLNQEKVQLLGIRARRNVTGVSGLGLFKAGAVKRENFRLAYHEGVLDDLVIEAGQLAEEIQQLGSEVSALRQELDIRTDAPLTKVEAAMNAASGQDKQMLMIFGAVAITLLVIVITKKKKE